MTVDADVLLPVNCPVILAIFIRLLNKTPNMTTVQSFWLRVEISEYSKFIFVDILIIIIIIIIIIMAVQLFMQSFSLHNQLLPSSSILDKGLPIWHF
jgi:hypothetical protein